VISPGLPQSGTARRGLGLRVALPPTQEVFSCRPDQIWTRARPPHLLPLGPLAFNGEGEVIRAGVCPVASRDEPRMKWHKVRVTGTEKNDPAEGEYE
jgi:hypothetical protein